MSRPRILIHTLGCKVNQYDSSQIASALAATGCDVVTAPPAHAVIINSCIVTNTAEAKSRQAIRRLKRANPDAIIISTGCGPKANVLTPQVMTEVDYVVTGSPDHIARSILNLLNSQPTKTTGQLPQGRTRALIKVQEGCPGSCTYCIVPSVRGKPHSRQISDVLTEINELIKSGYKELVLCGTNLALYGSDLDSDTNLHTLLKKLPITNTMRYRLSSLEPEYLDPGLIEYVITADHICPHLHLVLQSGSDRILKLMGRTYKTTDYNRLVTTARSLNENCAITTDIIVGFPGEQQSDFHQTVAFINQMKFSRMHIFPFSPRPGTKAAELPLIPDHIVTERASILRDINSQLMKAFACQQLGTVRQVLTERKDKHYAIGLTDNYITARIPKADTNELISICITDTDGDTVIGTRDND